jgi:DNA repair exonuclease SbcCD ATPase subunit
METKVKIGEGSKVVVKWKVSPIDYSREEENNIIVKMANKYGISKDNIRVEAQFVTRDENGNEEKYNNEIVNNINDPVFQQNLFREYIKEKGIEDCDINKIIEIDNYINNSIDYDKYDKNKEYAIKWIKWSNFMSYGPDNFIDFTTLKGLILLSSNPSNQGGKSTFCVDLIRFLLFGKVTSRESDWTLSKVFNKHIPEATEVSVEGCVCIDGVDYIIKRVVSRPSLQKRSEKSKVTQKVNYYKLVNDELLDLVDEENQEGVSTTQTNKSIKEAIGNEKDFDLMICVNSDNLKGLISLKDTERGRLLSRWIGLLPLEEKDKISRETFNKVITPKLLLNRYNKEELIVENESLTKEIEDTNVEVEKYNNKLQESINKVNEYKTKRDELFQSKQKIDESLTKVDVKTIENKLNVVIENGKMKSAEKETLTLKLKEIGTVNFSEDEYKSLNESITKVSVDINTTKININNINKEIDGLKKGEFCPTCGSKLKDVDNTQKIKEKNELLKTYNETLITLEEKLEINKKKRDELENSRQLYNEKNRTELLIAKLEVDIDNLRKDYREYKRILTEIEANKSAIEQNNIIQNNINIIDVNIKTEEGIINNTQRSLNDFKYLIERNNKDIQKNNQIIETINKEEVSVRNWKIYLDLVGKNGITKMVLRNTLPIINSELSQLLNDVCDFTVEVAIDERQDVTFYLIHDGVKSDLASGSGLEQTVASLALRSVLGKISTFSKPSFVVFDEILGGVSDENYENVKRLYDKIVGDYTTILEITHLKAIHDWHDKSILINKKDNISTISML